MTDTEGQQKGSRIAGVYVIHHERIAVVLRDHYPKVLAAHRFFEEETGFHNEIASNNLNDALSHLGTLFEDPENMTYAEQGNEVHDFEGHLRRAMMESYEQLFKRWMGVVDELWKKHQRLVRPLLAKGKIHGVAPLDELEGRRRRCKRLLDEGREAKRGHSWQAWDAGTESLANACIEAGKLKNDLDAGIASAQDMRRHRSGVRANLATAVAVAALALPAGYLFDRTINDRSVVVPDLRELRVSAAISRLAEVGLRPVADQPNRGARCRVASVAPQSGQAVPEGATVALVLRCAPPLNERRVARDR